MVPVFAEVSMAPRLMLVEDERIVAAALEDQLRNHGYDVVANVGRGERAIVGALRIRPDVMLVDINLGDALDGIEVVESIHDQTRIPTVFMTAYADERTMERVARVTPIPCARKPIEERLLVCLLRLALHVDALHGEVARLRAKVERMGGTVGSPAPLTPDAGNEF